MTVWTVDEQATCGCGQHTTGVRIDGEPWRWACKQRAEAATAEPGDQDDQDDDAPRYRFLAGLEGTYAPKKAPYWRAPMPDAMENVIIPMGWNWRRAYAGPVVRLDKNAAYLGAAASVSVARGTYEPCGPMDIRDATKPGLYKVRVHPWREDGMPHPLGGSGRHDEVWIPAPRASLLRKLAGEGRWPDETVIDSWVASESLRLTDWTNWVKTVRATVLRTHGPDSAEYARVKREFGQARSLMRGYREAGQPRKWNCKTARPDWAIAIEDVSAVTMWTTADACRKLTPGFGPVSLRNTDELFIPAEAYDIVTTDRPGADRPIRIDPSGITLGTFKVKGREVWE